MTKSLRIAALAAGLAVLPVAAMAQDEPTAPDRSNEVQTGTRIQTITVIGAIRGPARDEAGRAPGRPEPSRAAGHL